MSTNETEIVQPVAEPVAAPVAPEAPAAPAETPKIDPKDRRDLLAREFNKPNERGKHAQHQPREQGKFAGPPKFPTPQQAQAPTAPVAPVAPAPIKRPDMPASLKQDLKPYWEQAHPDLLADIVRRDEDHRKGVEPLRTKAQQADDLLNEFKPYEMLMTMEGVTPKQAIAPLLQTAAILRMGTPAQKAQAAAQMIRQYNIPVDHIQGFLSGNAPPTVVQDPQVSQLAQQVEQLKALQEQQSLARVQKEIEAFASNPEHQHFAAVQPAMVRHLNAMKEDPDWADKPEREKLEAAYQTAIYADPQIRQQVLAEQQAKQRTEQQIADARNAAVQVTGAPSAGPAPPVNPKDRLALLRNQFQMQR